MERAGARPEHGTVRPHAARPGRPIGDSPGEEWRGVAADQGDDRDQGTHARNGVTKRRPHIRSEADRSPDDGSEESVYPLAPTAICSATKMVHLTRSVSLFIQKYELFEPRSAILVYL